VRKGIGVTVSSAAKRFLINKGYSVKFGARPLRRVIEDEVEHMIAEGILEGSYQKGAILEIGIEKGELKVNDNRERVVLARK
jgi:ATP-dependent Clp protease ATP-binding subunit ClpA